MSLSIHYFVLSLGAERVTLFEAFRDSLIEVENQGFPVLIHAQAGNALDESQLRTLMHTVDDCFGHYQSLDPRKLVVVGEEHMQSLFLSVTSHWTAVIGRIEGDHTTTSARDLGQIAWSVVKAAMSGMLDNAMHDLKVFAGRGETASGLAAVAGLAVQGVRATLLVEDDYRVKGRIGGTRAVPIVSSEIDVRDVVDDAVDVVVERILECGGTVVFTPSGSLSDRERIVLLLHGTTT